MYNKRVQIIYWKTVSLALLVVVLFMFTGLSSVVSGFSTASAKSCCDACSKEKTRTADACSTPDCPLDLCLTANAASPLTVLAPESVGFALSFVEIHSPYSAVKSVFHPPAFA
jgi:hypothetical protein